VAIPGLAEFLDVREYVVKADPAVQIAMLRRISHWRERHLLQKVEPPMDGSRACRDALSDRFGELKSPVRRAEGEEADMIRRYAAINAEIKELTRQKAKLRNEIVAAIADGKGLTLSSGGKAILGRPKNRTPMLRVSGVKHDG
jgi:predicted phage-related endonuclease